MLMLCLSLTSQLGCCGVLAWEQGAPNLVGPGWTRLRWLCDFELGSIELLQVAAVARPPRLSLVAPLGVLRGRCGVVASVGRPAAAAMLARCSSKEARHRRHAVACLRR